MQEIKDEGREIRERYLKRAKGIKVVENINERDAGSWRDFAIGSNALPCCVREI